MAVLRRLKLNVESDSFGESYKTCLCLTVDNLQRRVAAKNVVDEKESFRQLPSTTVLVALSRRSSIHTLSSHVLIVTVEYENLNPIQGIKWFTLLPTSPPHTIAPPSRRPHRFRIVNTHRINSSPLVHLPATIG